MCGSLYSKIVGLVSESCLKEDPQCVTVCVCQAYRPSDFTSPINKCLHVHMYVPNNVMFGDMNFRAEIIIETAKTVRAVA